MSAPHFLQMRYFLSPSSRYPMRVALPHLEHIILIFDMLNGAGAVIFCPFLPARRAFRCFVRRFIPSTIIFASCGNARSTFPVFFLSLPEITMTISPFFIFMAVLPVPRPAWAVPPDCYMSSCANVAILANPLSFIS